METASRLRGVLRGSAVIAVAMGVMNVTTYAFTILAARLLGPVEYGAVAAVMGLLLVLNVMSLGLQATGARRISSSPDDLAQIEREMMRASYYSGFLLFGAALVAAPLVSALLNLESWTVAALIAVTVVPLSIMGSQAGILQGERRWRALAGIYVAVGLGRIAFGTAALLLRPDTLGALLGVTIGAFAPIVVGWLALRNPARTGDRSARPRPVPGPHWARGGVLRETLANSHALLAFFALSNIDVLIARVVLDEQPAGLYAAGLILTKAVLFLPQFVVVIVFPSMARSGTARRMNLMALGLVLLIGLSTVAGTAWLSGLAVTFVGGAEYADLREVLWAFAGLGTLLAMLQLMVYNLVARQRQRSVYTIWAALGVLLAAGPLVGSLTELLVVVIAVDGLLFAVMLLSAWARPHAPVEAPAGS